ncbi:trigger factor [Spirochaetia bacterium]|nr:trigger factor [Spirochaetia bacterium]
MAIDKGFEKLEKSAVKVTYTIKNDEVRQKYNEFAKNIAKSVQIPGFRKGKAPVSVLESKLGDRLKEDILNEIISKTVLGSFEEPDFPPEYTPLQGADPSIDGEPKLDLNTDFVFSVKYDVMPKVELKKWEGLEIEVDEALVTDADVERELEKLRERNAIVMDKEEGSPAEKNNILSVDYAELSDTGEALPDSERKDFIWTLGTNANYYKIDDDLTGMKSGETRDITKSYPENFDIPDLAGKTKKLRVKINSIKKKELPELNDDLAQDVDEKYKTLDDLKKDIRESLNKRLEDTLKTKKFNSLLEKMREENPVEIPESLIIVELAERMQQFSKAYKIPEKDFSDFFRRSSPLMEMWRPDTEKSIHNQFLLAEVIKDSNIEVTDADIDALIVKEAEARGEPVEDVKKLFESEEAKNTLDNIIKSEKITELLLSKNTIKKGKTVNFLDIIPEN